MDMEDYHPRNLAIDYHELLEETELSKEENCVIPSELEDYS